MQHTTNYNLNQWEADDKITRADFNADNAAIDAALTAVADAAESNAPVVVKLLDYTVPSAARQVDVDLSGIDLTQYVELWVHMELRANSGRIYMRCNNISTNSYCISSNYVSYLAYPAGQNDYCTRRLILTPGSGSITALNLTGRSNSSLSSSIDFGVITSVNASTLQTLNFYTDEGTIAADGRIRIYGLKK